MLRNTFPTFAAFAVIAWLMSCLTAPWLPVEDAGPDFARTLALVGPDPVTGQARVITPDNHLLTPAGKQISLPGMRPQALALSPNGRVLAVAGKTSGLTLINPATGDISGRVELPGNVEEAPDPVSANILKPDRSGQVSFTGLIFSADGGRLFLSNVNGSIKEFSVSDDGTVKPVRNLPLPPANAPGRKNEIPSGLALSDDGSKLYIALNLSNRVAEMELSSGAVVRTWDCGVAPYDVRRIGSKLYVSNWGGRRPAPTDPQAHAGRGMMVRVDPTTHVANEGSLSIVDLTKNDPPQELITGSHASGLAVSPDGKFLCVACATSDFIAVLDVASAAWRGRYFPKQTPADLFGAAPNALTFAPDGKRLYCCNGSQNAVAVLDWEDGRVEFEGLLPTGWYPGAIVCDAVRQQLCVANIKGIGSEKGRNGGFNTHQYFGTVSVIPLPPDQLALTASTQTVNFNNRAPLLPAAMAPARANVLPRAVPVRVGEPSVFKHVLYIIKENRTYDQVLGDLKTGNGDPNLCVFGEDITPNQHQLCRDFVLLDNTYCSGILSADGHNWSCSGITTDYMERQFAGFPRSYPDGSEPANADALASAPGGFLWDLALGKGLAVRLFGEFATITRAWKNPSREGKPFFPEIWQDWQRHHGSAESEVALGATGNMATVIPLLSPTFPAYDNDVPDQLRAHAFIQHLKQWEASGQMPALSIMSLPGDHTSATKPGKPTPRAHVADNDLAMGQIISALSQSRFWKDTCVISIEDDPQNGWDHVSGYRTTCFVASAWSRGRGTVSTQYNQTSVLRTIELILGLPPMNELDATATPMFDCFGPEPDFTPVLVRQPRCALDELNPAPGKITDATLRRDAEVSETLPLAEMDQCPEGVLNEILWRALKGPQVAFPAWAVTLTEDDD